jgi:hypothetical protein
MAAIILLEKPKTPRRKLSEPTAKEDKMEKSCAHCFCEREEKEFLYKRPDDGDYFEEFYCDMNCAILRNKIERN